VPRDRVDTNWHFIDNYSWKIGRHDVKFGYEFRRTSITITQDTNFRGKLSFPDLVSYVEGIPSGGSEASGDSRRHEFENSEGLYIQDSFRWTPRLTVTMGLRWDYFGVPGEKNNLFYRIYQTPAGGSLLRVGSGAGSPSGLYNPDYNNFAPRVGFAYDIGGKGQTVIRAGWGMFYDAFSQDMFLGHIPYNCTFCPGPAFTGIGPAPISFYGLSGNPITAGSPVYSSPSPLGSFFGIDPNIRTPWTQNWNVNIQQAIGKKAMAQIAYVGAKGTDLFRFRDINQPSQGQITAYDTGPACAGGYTPPNCPIAGFDSGSNVPRTAYSNFFYVNQEESTANSIYNSLQLSFNVNSWHGLSTQANFVWSHSIDNASDLEDFIPNASQPNNSLAPQLERGNSNFDIRRRFSWNFVYQFPKSTGSYTKLKNG